MLMRLAASPYSGLVVMVAGLFANAFTDSWLAFVVGAVWAIGALFWENRHLKSRLEPTLAFVFKPEMGKPYVEDRPSGFTGESLIRTFRVGVLNTGEPSKGVSVIVRRLQPEHENARLGIALQRMGAPMHEGEIQSGTFDVYKSTEPTVFIAVLMQVFYTGSPEVKQLHVRYASGDERIDATQIEYQLWLAIRGAGAPADQKFVLKREGDAFVMAASLL
jgi:hypothetical protein